MHRIALSSLLLMPVSTAAQLLPYSEGSRVRFMTDSTPHWLYASVLDGNRNNIFIVTDNTRRILLLPFNEALQLQVYTGRSKGTMLFGLGAGLAVGATLGATVLSETFGTRGPGQSSAQNAVVLGAVGALIGTIVASRLGPKRWRDLPVQSGYLRPAPLTVTDPEPASIRQRVHRWRRFDATMEDFEAFFTIHRDSLHGIEGIWTNALGRDPVAVVRDNRFPGFEYVVVSAPRATRRSSARSGRIRQVLRRMEATGRFEIIQPGREDNPDGAYYELVGDKLVLHDRQEQFSAPIELIRLFPD